MKSTKTWLSQLLLCGATLLGSAPSPVDAAPAMPDLCKLVTTAEIEQIVGRLKGPPRAGDVASGDVSCEYAPLKPPSWIEIRVHDGDLSAWRQRNGGKNPVSLPEFGKEAFMNPDFEGSADLYAKKGGLILRVSVPKGPGAVDLVKAIAKLALPRL